MQKHVKNYLKYFGYGIDDFVKCEVCSFEAVDLHHIIYRSQGGSDGVENIIALCRDCHNAAHDCEITKEYLFDIHKKFMGV
jgi:5-methylcytosine-specific restriction endonuclease McrA